MAKNWRTLKFTYNSTTITAGLLLERENIPKQGFSSIRRTLDGTGYKQFTTVNQKRNFNYSFALCNSDVYDFFKAAENAHLSGYDVVFDLEQDDGSFNSYAVFISPLQYDDSTIGDTGKLYSGLSVVMQEA